MMVHWAVLSCFESLLFMKRNISINLHSSCTTKQSCRAELSRAELSRPERSIARTHTHTHTPTTELQPSNIGRNIFITHLAKNLFDIGFRFVQTFHRGRFIAHLKMVIVVMIVVIVLQLARQTQFDRDKEYRKNGFLFGFLLGRKNHFTSH